MSEFIGHFHPVLVHLPIGILLLACFFRLLTDKQKYTALQPAIKIALFWGMISAIVSCISGYLLSDTGDYDEQLVSQHQWFGIGVAVISIIFYFLSKKGIETKSTKVSAFLLIGLIIITGHLGGTLTHGEGYLTNSLFGDGGESAATVIRKPIPNVQEAIVYTDIIQPLLQNKCYNCHGSTRQKGKLRMDQPEFLMKGGKDGVIIKVNDPDKSEMIKRLLLAREEEHHMPPKEKSQLTQKEIALLHWWIAGGASFTRKAKEMDQPEKIKPILLSLQNPEAEKKPDEDIPLTTVDKADDAAIKKLRDKGTVIMPVSVNSNYLLANFVTSTANSDKDMEMLLPIKNQLVWLKLGETKISDAGMFTIGKCVHLTKLQLDNTGITDKGLTSLQTLQQLRVLSLVGTNVTAAGLQQLKGLKQLQSIFLYQAKIEKKDWGMLQKIFPKAHLDSGGYQVPTFISDTTLVKAPPKN